MNFNSDYLRGLWRQHMAMFKGPNLNVEVAIKIANY